MTETGTRARLEFPAPPVRHQQLIVTIFGLYSRGPDAAMPVSALVALLGDLGYDAPGVRSSVSRLKAKDVLKSVRTDKVAKYALSESVLEVFKEGDARIFSPTRSVAGDAWVLAIFSVPEAVRNKRHQLRSELSWLGFGSVASGVWIAPAGVLGETRRRLEKRGLGQFVEFFRGDYLAEGDMRTKVAQWWDLAALDEQLGEFLDFYHDAAEQWLGLLGDDPDQALARSTPELRADAFRYYIPMLTAWRRFPYRDPSLPLEFLPDGWKGPQARAAFSTVHRLISRLAAAHAHSIIDAAGR
ncbi:MULTISPECIES: PaaX family transcriptional regulator C-terminal domain-containing protein [unclassified Arthrobacter]|uniref:PaaX family transcriptional regulator n=1 Tax=unclassified Arthrobacter TaxID=235627 RepID=UPI00211A800D|nr:PaaX family transcriptional regulator C-terminal domain-containing protein [Arthrobacter sp. STN4]MCQ9165576.1 PaaX family transcriptional regulator [Arthrobacter sp. STN4]